MHAIMIVNMDRLYNHILLIVQAMTLILIFFSIVARFNHILLDAFFFIIYLFCPDGLQDLSSLTRDRTLVLCSESAES